MSSFNYHVRGRGRIFVVRLVLAAVCAAVPVVALPPTLRAQSGTATLTLSPDDTFIKLDTVNYRNVTTLGTYTWPDYQVANAIVLKFNVSAIPAGAVIQEATLRLALVEADTKISTLYNISAHKLLGRNPDLAGASGYMSDAGASWTPSECCYNGIPMAQADISSAYTITAVDKTLGFKSWNITAMVQEWQSNPTSNFGLLLNADTSKRKDGYRYFASMENPDQTLRPSLQITYAVSGSIPTDTTPSSVSTSSTSSSQSLRLSPQDTSINLDTTNYSTAGALTAYTWPDYNAANAILMKFNLSALPAGSVVQSATLNLSLIGTDSSPEPTYTMTAHKIRNRNPNIAAATGYTADGVTGWTANSCCYNGIPLAQADISFAYDQRDIDKTPGFKSWNLTSIVQEWLANPASDFGVLLNSDATKPKDRWRYFASMEYADPSQRPYLQIQYTTSSGLSSISGTGSGDINSSISLTSPLVKLSPQDTSINLDTTNYSTAGALTAYTWPDYHAANAILMKFNIAALPAGSVVQSATLNLSLIGTDSSPEPTYTMTAHKIRNRNPNIAAATGYTADGVAGWTANSCCYNDIPLAQSDISFAYDQRAIDKTPGFKTWNLTSLVQEWLANPASNFGVLLNSDATRPKDRWRYFASMEHADPSQRPYLQIQYTAPSGATIAGGGGGGDTTAPSISLTTPASGAIVSGTVSVTAAASDNVGVVGVQFTLDGSNLGGEDGSAPYSVAWNSAGVADSSHTLSAVARDAAGNQRVAAPITVSVSNIAPPPTQTGGLSAKYPGDVGIENDPSVIFVEKFEETTLAGMLNRWTTAAPNTMSFSSDVPAGSPAGSHSINVPSIYGVDSGGQLYYTFPGVDVLYVRYYTKYASTGTPHHSGIWVGGYNPGSAWPDPRAGTKPAGYERFIAGAEQNQVGRFEHYNYWMNMHPDGFGAYWGNFLLNKPSVAIPFEQWTCVEEMVKLNYPTTAFNGEHALWLDGVKVSHLGQGFPNGYWSGGIFTQDPSGTPFEGMRWRSDENLKVNWLWLQNYSDNLSTSVKFDHVVAATSYIGCLK